MRGSNYENHRALLHDARLYTPQMPTLQVIEAETPRETPTDKISALIERIRGKTRDDAAAIHPSVDRWHVTELSIAGDCKAWEARRRCPENPQLKKRLAIVV